MTRDEILKNTRSDQREVAAKLMDYIDALFADAMDEVAEITSILAEDVLAHSKRSKSLNSTSFPSPALDGVPALEETPAPKKKAK